MDGGCAIRRGAARTGTPGRLRRSGFVLVLLALSFGATAAPAGADGTTLPCTPRSTSAVFARWLDPAQYFSAPNGGFEDGADQWTLRGGAAVVAGNESFQVGGAADGSSLALGPDASAESHTACVTLGEPTMRLFVRAPRVLGSRLTVTATVRNPTTGLTLSTSWVVLGGLAPATWAPTPEILVPNLLGGLLTQELTLQFRTSGVPATWGVDDVYVDPFKQR